MRHWIFVIACVVGSLMILAEPEPVDIEGKAGVEAPGPSVTTDQIGTLTVSTSNALRPAVMDGSGNLPAGGNVIGVQGSVALPTGASTASYSSGLNVVVGRRESGR